MNVQTYSIQELCDRSGLPRRTIHFYTQQGILPPPNGAGLAARYEEGHLVRLLLIPLLRQQGLRLDDVRKKFQELGGQELTSLYNELQSQIVVQPAPVRGEVFQHYPLPAGMVLMVPGGSNQKKVMEVLQAIERIFNPQHEGRPIPLVESFAERKE